MSMALSSLRSVTVYSTYSLTKHCLGTKCLTHKLLLPPSSSRQSNPYGSKAGQQLQKTKFQKASRKNNTTPMQSQSNQKNPRQRPLAIMPTRSMCVPRLPSYQNVAGAGAADKREEWGAYVPRPYNEGNHGNESITIPDSYHVCYMKALV